MALGGAEGDDPLEDLPSLRLVGRRLRRGAGRQQGDGRRQAHP
jgi:hypothetical protein